MGCSLISCAQCCTVFSFFGFFFLLIIGSLLNSQPLYIKGPEDYAKASSACYQGSLGYLVTLIVSVAYWAFDIARKKASGGAANGTVKFGGKYGAVVTDQH